MNRYGFLKMGKLDNFGPVYLINLKDHEHRLANAKSEFAKYNISDYTIIEAVDGRKSDLSEIIDGKYPNLKPSEIGCIASHIKAMKHWLDTSDSEYAVIMEDDFSFDTVESWSFDWDDVINSLPKSAEIVQLIMIKNEPLKFNLHKKEKYESVNLKTYEWSTACYIIKRSYAKSLVKIHTSKDKYVFKNHGFGNQAADVILYSLGNAYCMPIFTHILDAKNSINGEHNSFHTKSKTSIDTWWKINGKKQDKSKLFNINENIISKSTGQKACFTIFHVEKDTPEMEKRNVLVRRAKAVLKDDFEELNTPTIIMKTKEDVQTFYKSSDIRIDPKGFEGNGWKAGELGIWASNYTAWKNFVDSDYDYIILMEDDIVLSKDFNKKLKHYISELPNDWDAFTAFVPRTGNVRYNKNNKNLFIDKKNVCRVYQSWSCLCYVVSKKGAVKILEEVKTPVSSPIDHYLFYHKGIDVYTIKMEKPNICEIYPTSSTVQSADKQDMTGYV
jgi:GR25 family glycosyltransferase involved in LPS biosynthesis